MTSPAAAAALARLGASVDPATSGAAVKPPARTAVIHEFSPTCTCCDRQVAYVVPAYWNPERIQLCADCCLVWCEDHPDDRAWPAAGRWTPSRDDEEPAA